MTWLHRAIVLPLVLLLATGTARAEPLRIGVGNRIAALPLHVAASRGYFEREGLEVVLSVEANADALVEGLAEETFDLATLSTNRLLGTNATGLELRGAYVLARSGASDALIANADIADTRRLRGRRIAVAPDSPGELLLRWALQRKGRRLANVELVPLEGDAAVRALLDGDVDAAALHGVELAPFAADAVADEADANAAGPARFRTLATAADTPGLVHDLLVGTERSLARGKTATKGVVRAIDRAIGWMRRHPTETLALLAEHRFSEAPNADAARERALRGTALLDVAENMDLLRGDFQKAFSGMSEVLDAGGGDRAREVPSANRFLALSALRQVAAGR